MRPLLSSLAAGAAAVVLLVAGAALAGIDPATLLRTLVRGAVGSPYAIGESLVKSVPLLLTALSVSVAFRAGFWNIGAEGQFVVGAIAAFSASSLLTTSVASIPVALAAGAAAGAAWALIAALLKLRRGIPEVLTTILLNFVAIHLLGYLVNGPLREASGQYPQSDALAAASRLPRFSGDRVHYGFVVALVIAAALYWLLLRTVTGLRIRATGHNAAAAQFAGVDVVRYTLLAAAISGACAAAAGALELMGVTHRLFERFASGYGYAGIAVALLARLHPLAAVASALFFGAIGSASGELQRAGVASSAFATLLQGLVIALVVSGSAWQASRSKEAA